MTGSGKFAILVLLFAGALLCGSEGRVVQFGSINLRVSLEAAPSVVRTAGGGGIYSSGGTVLTNKRWVAIMVSYIPGVASRKTPKTRNVSSNAKGVQSARGLWIDDVKMRVLVAYPAANPRRTNVVYGLFEGVTHFWTIRLDGQRHTAQMFIPPQLLDRYAAPTLNGRREVALVPGDFRVMVEFSTSDGKLLGRVCSQNTAAKTGNPYAFFTSLLTSPGATVVKDAILPRNKTPWAWYMPSTFDYIKEKPAVSFGSAGGAGPVKE